MTSSGEIVEASSGFGTDDSLPQRAQATLGPSRDATHSFSSTTSGRSGLNGIPPSRLKSATVSHPAQALGRSRHRHTASTVPTALPLDIPEPDALPIKESDYLIELASRERRVLELKDELRRAEDELSDLKNQWASHESTKRRSEARRMHQMRPMSVSHTRVVRADDPDGSSAWMYEEMERRKALMGHSRPSSRRVFSGSRHAKKLSLVPSMVEEQLLAGGRHADGVGGDPNQERNEKSKSTSDLAAKNQNGRMFPPYPRADLSAPQREVFQTGKQLATEWRDGLWTFFEDLKHATVGDEQNLERSNVEASKTWTSLIRPQPRTVPDDDNLIDTGEFWREHGLDLSGDSKHSTASLPYLEKQTPQKTALHTREFEGESWETWDTPDAKQDSPGLSSGTSTSRSITSGSPPASSPATSVEATPRASLGSQRSTKRDSIPWPTLTKFAPGQLRRTASHLMDEWERSLSPPNDGDSSRKTSILDHDQDIEHALMSQMR